MHFTSSIRRRDRKPPSRSSSSPSGIGAVAQIRQHGLGAQRDGDFEPPPETFRDAVMLCAPLVALPVHAGGAAVEDLHAVRADVAHAGFRIFREHQRKRDELTAVVRPAFQDRKQVERAVAADDLLTRRVLDGLRHQVAQPADHRQHLQRVHDAFGHLRRHQLVDLFRQVVERLHAKRQAHALVRSVQVGHRGDVEPGGLLEQQRRSATRELARAIGHRRNLEIGAHRLRHARQQPPFVEVREEVGEIGIHASTSPPPSYRRSPARARGRVARHRR